MVVCLFRGHSAIAKALLDVGALCNILVATGRHPNDAKKKETRLAAETLVEVVRRRRYKSDSFSFHISISSFDTLPSCYFCTPTISYLDSTHYPYSMPFILGISTRCKCSCRTNVATPRRSIARQKSTQKTWQRLGIADDVTLHTFCANDEM